MVPVFPVRTSVERWHTVCPLVQHLSCLASALLYWNRVVKQTRLVATERELGAAGTARRHRSRAGGQEGEGATLAPVSYLYT